MRIYRKKMPAALEINSTMKIDEDFFQFASLFDFKAPWPQLLGGPILVSWVLKPRTVIFLLDQGQSWL